MAISVRILPFRRTDPLHECCIEVGRSEVEKDQLVKQFECLTVSEGSLRQNQPSISGAGRGIV